LNILASARQGWTDVVSGTWLFWACMGFAGFTPVQIGIYFALLLLWQAGVHVEWAPKLGPLEWLLVTPSHHRVHHSLERAHIDRNFGGVLIVWDRLFGTFAPEGPAILHGFGLEGFDADAASPVGIATREWRRMLPRRLPAG
jgi:sterol desaturase/sphingolipid hydroxylase (fatty acid hydroxylase superfamily)